MAETQFKKISEYEYEIPKSGDMKIPIRIFVNEEMLKNLKKDQTLEQAKNMAKLPGLVGWISVLSDAHQGYGSCIGGVMASDAENGIISPGAVGFDINCGVRVLQTNIPIDKFMKKRKELMHDLTRTIPAGVGRGGEKISKEDIKDILKQGSSWNFKKGFATKDDLDRTEANGKLSGFPDYVSDRAISRGINQLGTLGAGNHFIDIHKVEKILDNKVAKVFGINKDNVIVMIHCGSRGLGHQVCSDYLREIEKTYGVEKFPDRELAYAPIKSDIGKRYLGAMQAAANFAFANRQMITHNIRKMLKYHFPNAKANLVYDVAHNIVKIEEYEINGMKKKVLVHRKGATRSFGSGKKDIPKVYKKVGQPVLIPGSMATPSYILVGTKQADNKTFGSSVHGAGRAHSRTYMRKNLTISEVKRYLEEKNIHLETRGEKGMLEEFFEAYKDINKVVQASDSAGIGRPVVKLIPLAVMIG